MIIPIIDYPLIKAYKPTYFQTPFYCILEPVPASLEGFSGLSHLSGRKANWKITIFGKSTN